MKSVTIHPYRDNVLVNTGTHVVQGLLARKCNVAMACGGQGICATCHVYVREGKESLSPMTEREKRTLSTLTGVKPNSRLSCQSCVQGEGVEVELPVGTYVNHVHDLLERVGQRTEVPILHPKDGRVLIEAGKIITKSRILELEGETSGTLFARQGS
jgi:ferredoxin